MSDVFKARSTFEADTAVDAVGDCHFTAEVTDRWDGLAGRPLGGYVLAVGLRALRNVMPFPDLLVASAFFLRPVTPGPMDVCVETVRIGRRTATGQASLVKDGREAVRTVATFADLSTAEGPTSMFCQPPELPAPADAVDLHSGGSPPTASIADRVEYRLAAAQASGPSGDPNIQLWMRLTEGGEDDTLIVPFLVDAAPPAVMELGAAGSTTIELTVHVRARPSPGWMACRASTRSVIDGYHEEDLELWSEDGQLLAQSRQLALLPGGWPASPHSPPVSPASPQPCGPSPSPGRRRPLSPPLNTSRKDTSSNGCRRTDRSLRRVVERARPGPATQGNRDTVDP